MSSLLQELRHSLRFLLRERSFTVVMVLTLTVGVGASSTLFSVLNGVLLEPLPYPDSEELVFFRTDFDGGKNLPAISGPEFRDLRRDSRTLEALAGMWVQADNLTGTDQIEDKLIVAWVTRDFFTFFGSEMAQGTEFREDSDGESGSDAAIILSHEFWTRRYGADPDILGTTIEVNREKRVVAGVSAPGFSVLSPSAMRGYPRIDAFVPIPTDWWFTDWGLNRDDHWLSTFARLEDGATLELMQAEMDTLTAAWQGDHVAVYQDRGFRVRVTTMHADLVSGIKKPIVLLFVGGLGVLFIAGCNATSLYLARGISRDQEFALRSALGAGGTRLFRQLLTESFVLVSAAGALGFLPVLGVEAALKAIYPGAFPLRDRIAPDPAVLLFTLAVMAVATVLMADLSLRATRSRSLYPALKNLASDTKKSAGGRRALVSIQVALAVALLTGSVLLVETSARLGELDLGFSPENVLTLSVGTSQMAPDRSSQHFDELVERVEALADVESVGFVSSPPFAGLRGGAYNRTWPFRLDRDPPDPRRRAYFHVFTPGYFETLRARLVAGRWIGERDKALGTSEIMVDEVLANRTWPDSDPVGQQLHINVPFTNNVLTARVAGVVGHVQYEHLKAERRPQIYVPAWLLPNRQSLSLVVRVSRDPLGLVKPIAGEMRALGNDEAPTRITTLEAAVALAYADSNLILLVMSLFAASGLLLVVAGVYGIIAADVQYRRRETGIRMALGASARQVLFSFTGRGLSALSIGLLAGLVLSIATSRLLESQLYGVSSLEPIAFVSSIGVILIAGLLASAVPARRAALTEPAKILRSE